MRDNPILQSSIKIWQNMNVFVGRKGAFSYLTPLMGNRNFRPGVENAVLRSWYERGVRVVGDLFDDNNVLLSFTQIQNTFGLTQKDFFAYLQVRHFINTNFIPTQLETLMGPIDRFMIDFRPSKGFIKHFYIALQSFKQYNIDNLIKKKEDDLQNTYDDDAWEKCIQTIHSLFLSNGFRETQYRILHRQHRTPHVMNKIDTSRSPLCSKCKLTNGTYIHCFWTPFGLSAPFTSRKGRMPSGSPYRHSSLNGT